uniref:Uncharacterized protein n=1 Tax=Compsopogon caeruleus TaxID=31354 RepID=A0A7S1TFX5_9RHOD|mmetsp:Transcript_5451/g.11097  ORF Transcript_5451/g.11097 Transcript_5451/m.11097 type:complete len:469 (+) Transcript_5451:114-1520(+)
MDGQVGLDDSLSFRSIRARFEGNRPEKSSLERTTERAYSSDHDDQNPREAGSLETDKFPVVSGLARKFSTGKGLSLNENYDQERQDVRERDGGLMSEERRSLEGGQRDRVTKYSPTAIGDGTQWNVKTDGDSMKLSTAAMSNDGGKTGVQEDGSGNQSVRSLGSDLFEQRMVRELAQRFSPGDEFHGGRLTKSSPPYPLPPIGLASNFTVQQRATIFEKGKQATVGEKSGSEDKPEVEANDSESIEEEAGIVDCENVIAVAVEGNSDNTGANENHTPWGDRLENNERLYQKTGSIHSSDDRFLTNRKTPRMMEDEPSSNGAGAQAEETLIPIFESLQDTMTRSRKEFVSTDPHTSDDHQPQGDMPKVTQLTSNIYDERAIGVLSLSSPTHTEIDDLLSPSDRTESSFLTNPNIEEELLVKDAETKLGRYQGGWIRPSTIVTTAIIAAGTFLFLLGYTGRSLPSIEEDL